MSNQSDHAAELCFKFLEKITCGLFGTLRIPSLTLIVSFDLTCIYPRGYSYITTNDFFFQLTLRSFFYKRHRRMAFCLPLFNGFFFLLSSVLNIEK